MTVLPPLWSSSHNLELTPSIMQYFRALFSIMTTPPMQHIHTYVQDNIQQFLNKCQDLGLNDAQLFDTMDLQEIKVARKVG